VGQDQGGGERREIRTRCLFVGGRGGQGEVRGCCQEGLKMWSGTRSWGCGGEVGGTGGCPTVKGEESFFRGLEKTPESCQRGGKRRQWGLRLHFLWCGGGRKWTSQKKN